MDSRDHFSTWEISENTYVLMEIVSREEKTGDVGERTQRKEQSCEEEGDL